MTNENDLAFSPTRYNEISQADKDFPRNGLTKREYFAALAMQGLLSCYQAQVKICNEDPRYDEKNFAEVLGLNAAEFADGLIKSLNKPIEP